MKPDPRNLTNDRWMNFPEAQGKGVVTVDRNRIIAVTDLFDAKGQPVIGGSYIILEGGGPIPVLVGRHTVITTILMAEQGKHSDEPLAS